MNPWAKPEAGRVASALTDRVIASGHSLTDAWCYGNDWPGDWARIIDSVVPGTPWDDLFLRDTIPGSPMFWRWQQNTPARTGIAAYDLLIITEGGPPARPDVMGDRETLKNSVDYLFLFAENALVNGNGGAGAETVLHTINTWTHGVDGTDGGPDWGMGFRASMVQYERNFRWVADYVSWKLRQAHPGLGPGYRIWIAPHHRLWIRIWDALEAGTFPDYTSLPELFGDTIHPVGDAGYGLACLTFAMLYQQNPAEIAGFYVPPGMSPALRDWMWQNAWEIVTQYRWAGMGGSDEGQPGFDPETDEDPWGEPEPGELPDFVLSLTAAGYDGPELTGMPEATEGYFDMSSGVATATGFSLGASRYIAAMLRKPEPEKVMHPVVSTHSGSDWWNDRGVAMVYNGFAGIYDATQNAVSAGAGWVLDDTWQFVEIWADDTGLGGAVGLKDFGNPGTIRPMTPTTQLLIGGQPGSPLGIHIAGLWICDHKPELAQRAAVRELANATLQKPDIAATPWAGVGFGLAGLADWSTAQPLMNRFKGARLWAGHAEGRDWAFYQSGDLIANGHLDAHYNILSLPEGVDELGTCIFTEAPAGMTHLAGSYRLTWTGRATVTVNCPATTVSANELTLTYAPPLMLEVRVGNIDPRDPPKDFVLLHSRDIAAYEAGAQFCPVWLSVLGDVAQLRFMDWMGTNGSAQEDWQNRPHPADQFWTVRGAPLEVMVDLCNVTGKSGWFCIPHKANDGYITQFATYLRDHFTGPGLILFEYSNEFWNWSGSFSQTYWLEEQAIAAGWGSGGDQWMQMGGAKFANMARLINGLFEGHALAAQKRIVFSGFTVERAALSAPLWLADNPGEPAPATYVEAYATTGYIDGGLGFEDNAADIVALIGRSAAMAVKVADAQGLSGAAREAWLARHRFDYASAQALQSMLGRDIGLSEPNTGLEGVVEHWIYHRDIADSLGVPFIMYEGGTHVLIPPSLQDDAEAVAFYMHFNYSAEMAELYQAAHDEWVGVRGLRYNYFTECEGPGIYGFWGAARFAGDTNPRLSKIYQLATAAPARDPGE